MRLHESTIRALDLWQSRDVVYSWLNLPTQVEVTFKGWVTVVCKSDREVMTMLAPLPVLWRELDDLASRLGAQREEDM